MSDYKVETNKPQDIFQRSVIATEANAFLNNKEKLTYNTARMYRWAIKHFLIYYQHHVELPLQEFKMKLNARDPDVLEKVEKLKEELFNDLVDKEVKLGRGLRKGEVSYRYILGRAKTLLIFYGFDIAPVQDMLGKTSIEPPALEPLTLANLKKILSTIETNPDDEHTIKRNKTIVLLTFWSGLRAHELLSLKIGDIDFETGIGEVLGKGREEKEKFYIFPQGLKILKEYLQDRIDKKNDYVFPEFVSNDEANYYKLWRLINQISQQSEIKFTMHPIRHSIATWLAKQNYTPKEIQKFLRHKSEAMVLRYIDIGKDELSRKVGKTDTEI